MLWVINKDYTSVTFKSVGFPNPQIFLKLFWTNLQSPAYFYVTHRHNSDIQNVSLVWEMKKNSEQKQRQRLKKIDWNVYKLI